jgi:hypothetical protein
MSEVGGEVMKAGTLMVDRRWAHQVSGTKENQGREGWY